MYKIRSVSGRLYNRQTGVLNASSVSNYRPISLINNNLKIMNKILSNILASFIRSYIHKDQVEFILGRQGPDQIKREVDLISIMMSSWDLRKVTSFP